MHRTSARIIGWSFAILAAALSAAFAVTLSDDPAHRAALAAVSILAVAFERSALVWGRAARARGDWSAVIMARSLLIVAALYTAGMQLGFFASLMAGPMAADQAAQARAAGLTRQIAQLEERRAWLPRPSATVAAMRGQIAALERSRARAAAARLIQLRADLATAQSMEQIEAELVRLRAAQAISAGRAPADGKAAVLQATLGVDSRWAAFVAVVLGVLLLQAGQICLPILADGGAAIRAAPPSPASPQADNSPGKAAVGGKPKRTRAPKPSNLAGKLYPMPANGISPLHPLRARLAAA